MASKSIAQVAVVSTDENADENPSLHNTEENLPDYGIQLNNSQIITSKLSHLSHSQAAELYRDGDTE